MRKILIIFAALIFSLPIFSSSIDEDAREIKVISTYVEKAFKSELEEPSWLDNINLDAYFSTMLVRSSSFAIGAGVGLEYYTKYLGVGAYFEGFGQLSPVFSRKEMFFDTGVHFEWQLSEGLPVSTRFFLNVGYYFQILQPHRVYSDAYHTLHQGLSITPGINTTMNITKQYKMGIGVFFKKSVYPLFDGIDGIGIQITLV